MTLTIDDADDDARMKIASIMEEQGSLAEALEVLEAIGDSQDPILLTRIGRLLQKMGRLPEAETQLLSALKVEPSLWLARFFLGQVYQEQDRLEEAQRELLIASKFDESTASLNVLGDIQLDLGLKELARESFRKALALDPNDEEVTYNLGTTLRDESRDEAITLFERALEINPNYAPAHRELGWLLRRLEKFPEAQYHLRRALELNPKDGWVRIYLANLLWQLDDFAAAEDFFKQVIIIWPEAGLGYWTLAYFYERQGKTHLAEKLYYKAVEIDPNDAQGKSYLGNYLKRMGNISGARKYLTESIELDPTDMDVVESLASLDEESNKAPQ
jgi:tetratricopeptide (TPR) repeat protein